MKAAALAGAVIGFLWWLFFMPLGMSAMMGPGSGYYGVMGYMMGYTYPSFGLLSVVLGAILGAVAGVIIAVVYNWALEMR